MRKKVNDIHTINFVILLHTPPGRGNEKTKAESRKMGLQFFPMKFHGFISLYQIICKSLIYKQIH